MAKSIIQFKCLLMSPGDVTEERDAATTVISSWNAQIGEGLGAKVDLVRWETHSQPELGKHPQKLLNEQLVGDADFGVGIFWSKLGTQTDTHESGTVEEINGLIKKGAKVSLYISQKPIPQEMNVEYQGLKKYLDTLKHNGLFQNYTSTNEFRELLLLHITKTIVDLLMKEKAVNEYERLPEATIVESIKPQIVIKTDAAIVPDGRGETKCYLAITTQNHSSNSVFLGGIQIRLSDGRHIFLKRDAIFNTLNSRKELKPGQSDSFHVDPLLIMADIEDVELVSHVSVKDDIDRVYESEVGKLSDLIRSLVSL